MLHSSAYKEQRRHQQVWGMARGAGDGRLHSSEAGLIWARGVIAAHRLVIFWYVLLTFLFPEEYLAGAEKDIFLFIQISLTERPTEDDAA